MLHLINMMLVVQVGGRAPLRSLVQKTLFPCGFFPTFPLSTCNLCGDLKFRCFLHGNIQLVPKMAKDHRYFQFAKWIKEEQRSKTFSVCTNCSRCWQRVVLSVCVCHIFSYDFIHLCTIFSLLLFRLVFCICNYFCRHHTSFYSYMVPEMLAFCFAAKFKRSVRSAKESGSKNHFFCAVMATFSLSSRFVRLCVCVRMDFLGVVQQLLFFSHERWDIFNSIRERVFFEWFFVI